MKEIFTGVDDIDLSSVDTFVPVPLDGTDTIVQNPVARARRLRISIRFRNNLTPGTILSFRLRLGESGAGSALKEVHDISDTLTVGTPIPEKRPVWQTREFMLTQFTASPAPGDLQFVQLEVASDVNEGATVSVTVHVFDLDDVRSIGGTDVSLTNGDLDVNAASVGGNTPLIEPIDSNMTQISGDSNAADNLEATYDGTGYSNANAPAKQSTLGTPADIDSGGATIADNLKKIADNNGGDTFSAGRDSLNEIRTRGDLAWISGAGTVASKVYTITAITRNTGDDDGGIAGDVDVVDGTLFATGETVADPISVITADFTADDGAENPIEVLFWGFYNGGGTHHHDILAFNYTSSNYEKIGEIANSSSVNALKFSLSPDHINTSTGAISIRFTHDPSDSGNANHVFNIDKIVVSTATTSITSTNIEFIKNIEEADVTIDKTTTPWQMVFKIKSTGTELARKDLSDVDGADLVAIDTIVGQITEP